MSSFGPTSTHATSGEAGSGGGSSAFGEVRRLHASVLLGSDPNAYGAVHRFHVSALVGNDLLVPGTVRKSYVSVVLKAPDPTLDQAALHVVTGGTSGYGLLEQEALHAVTGGTSGYGLLEQAALHAVVYDLPAVRPVIISINT